MHRPFLGFSFMTS
uniref:Uncharacterized protein n=1 Tax=Arundo donax TaxID=35708 RepID=A0A0A9HM81_ARUDO